MLKPLFPLTPMLKSSLVASISIASIFSITSIADARPVNKKSVQNADSLPTQSLIVKQSQSNISQANLNGISQAISEYYRDRNNKAIPSSLEDGKQGCWFVEVKSLRLVALADNNAEVIAKIHDQNYKVKLISDRPTQWSYNKTLASHEDKVEHQIELKKLNGKWKVIVAVLKEIK
jgi:hypothetical protein